MNKKFISTKMKIVLLGLLISSIGFYASGCIVLFKSDYNLSDYTYKLNFNPNSFNYNFNFSNNFLNFINSYSSHDYDIDEDIYEITFNSTSQNIEVVNTNDSLLNIKIKSFSSSDTELDLVKNNNKMEFSSNINIPDYADIIISMPKFFSDKIILKITTRSGDININNFASNAINASSASGNINFKNSNLNYIYSSSSSGDINLNSINSYIETNLSCLSGSIKGDGTFGILTGTTSSGNVSLTFKDNLRNIFLSSVSGDIDLQLPSNSGYEVNYNTLSGDLNTDKSNLINNDKSNKININTTSGDLNINKV